MDPQTQAAQQVLATIRDPAVREAMTRFITTRQMPTGSALYILNERLKANGQRPLAQSGLNPASDLPNGGPGGLNEGGPSDSPTGNPPGAVTGAGVNLTPPQDSPPTPGYVSPNNPTGQDYNNVTIAPGGDTPGRVAASDRNAAPGLPAAGGGGDADTGTGVDTGPLGFAPGYEGARGGDQNALTAVLSAILQGLGVNQDRPGLFSDVAGDEIKKYLPFYMAMADKGKGQEAAQNLQGLFSGGNAYEGLRTFAQQKAKDLGGSEFGEAEIPFQQQIFHNLAQMVDAPVNRIAETLHNARLNRIEGQWGRQSLTNPQNYADFIRAHLSEMPEYASLLPLLGGSSTP